MPEDEFRENSEELVREGAGGLPEAVLSASCVPFRDRAGRNVGAITVLHDITAQKKMEQIKSDFVSMVSHEVRSPLNSVLAQLHVVTDGLAGEVTPKQMEILGRASEKIKSLLSLSTELLDLARIESGLITLEKERVNPAEILEDQAAFHEAAAREKQIPSRTLAAARTALRRRQQAKSGGSGLQSHRKRYQIHSAREGRWSFTPAPRASI